jgi:hypothetical protein
MEQTTYKFEEENICARAYVGDRRTSAYIPLNDKNIEEFDEEIQEDYKQFLNSIF